VATIGGFVIAVSMLPFLWNVFASLRNGKVAGDDPWEGNTLEWATSSPPPPYNFDRLPEIRSERPVFDARHGLVGHGRGHGGGSDDQPLALPAGGDAS
jgi:heme/copper-type cytochrome/quinol oxidase subunit 1